MLYFGMTDWSGQVTGAFENKIKKFLTKRNAFDKISKLSKTTTHQLERVEKEK